MKLHGRNRLQPLYGRDSHTDTWLRGWISEMTLANWKQARDVIRQFPQATNVAANVFHFRVGAQQVWIEVAMSFSPAMAIVTDLKHIN